MAETLDHPVNPTGTGTDGLIDDGLIDLVLVGGPSDFPVAERVRRAHEPDDEIKVEHRGGYEHFQRIDTTPEQSLGWAVYEWRYRTKVAE